MDEAEDGTGDATSTSDVEEADTVESPSRLGALLQARLRGVGDTSTDGFILIPGSSPAGEDEARAGGLAASIDTDYGC